MKKMILTAMTVAALVASAPLARANAFLELVSGTTTITTSLGNNASFTGITLGSWSIDIEASGTGHATPTLSVNLNTQSSGNNVTEGLSAYYSSGSYLVGPGTGTFSISQSGNTLAFTGELYTSTTGLWTGSGSLGTLFMSQLSLPVAASGNKSESGAFPSGPTVWVTEELDFGGGGLAPSGGGYQDMNSTASLNVAPDGGLTLVMLGFSLVVLAGIRSRLSKQS